MVRFLTMCIPTRVLLCAAALLAGLCCSGVSAADTDRVWFGPMAFSEERSVRDDFMPLLTDPGAWATVLSRTDVFKSYIMLLPSTPVPGETEPEVSDEEMRALIALLDAHDIQVAFEVAGARSVTPGAGTAMADNEFVHLRRWIDLGGSIDYLTTDHSIARCIETWLEGQDPSVSGAMSYDDPEVAAMIHAACVELAGYYGRMAALIPGVRFGAIESLGYWWVEYPAGRVYPPTRPDLPDMPFGAVFSHLLGVLAGEGISLDHFHTDFGYEGAAHDGRASGTLDYGRIMGVEGFVRERGVHNGNIVNAFHDRSVAAPDPATADAEAVANTLAFFEGYRAAGNDPDHWVLQTWQPYPHLTGPEDRPGTVMALHRRILTHAAFPATASTRLHHADRDGNGGIDLPEVLRFVQLYGAGGYGCDADSVDGFAPGSGGDTSCPRHDGDYGEPYWRISLGELLRVLQLHGSAGGYRYCPDAGTEDGFCPAE